MRIGLVYLGRHGPGGPISFELASQLSRKAEVFVVASENADHIQLWRESGLPLIEVRTFDTKLQALTSVVDPSRMRAVAGRIAAESPDVILYPMVHPWTPSLQTYLEGTPHVVTVHDPSAHPGFLHAASSLWEAISANRSTRCVVLGKRFVAEMQAKGVAADKIDVIPHPLFSFYDRFAGNSSLGPAPHSILFFGRITEYKGLDVLIQAFHTLRNRWPGLSLKIVGEGDTSLYRGQIDGASNVTVVNRWVDDAEVPEIFQSASIVVLPYVSASQSGVIPVAANFGCAVVATNVGAIPEQIQDGETGLLVEPGSAGALASAIEHLLADDGLRQRVAGQLARKTKATANWDAVSSAYLESCRKALASVTASAKHIPNLG
jgi:glycosyltransferase involved in cell wall biosynthesis